MRRTKNLAIINLLAAFLFLCSCEIFKEQTHKPDYIVTINELVKYPRASNLEKQVQTITGTTKWINSAPYLSSSNIEKIEAIPNESDKNFFDLKLKLNYRGKLMFTQLAADMLYKDFCFIVNDVMFRKLTPEMIEQQKGTDDVIILKVKLDPITAKAIADISEANYKHFNPDIKKPF